MRALFGPVEGGGDKKEKPYCCVYMDTPTIKML